MIELNDRLSEMISETANMSDRIDELKDGIKDQVHSILSSPPPRILFNRPSHRLLDEGVVNLSNKEERFSPPPLISFD